MSEDHKISNYILSGNHWFNHDLFITRLPHGMVQFKIEEDVVELPISLFEKFKSQVNGTVSYKGQKVTFPKMRAKDGGKVAISITTADKKVATSTPLWFCHYNTSVWHGLVDFLNNHVELFAIATCPNEKSIVSLISVDDSFKSRDTRYNNYGNTAMPSNREHIANFVEDINDFLKYSNQPILVENREKLEKLLEITFPDNRVFDFEKEFNFSWDKRDEKLLRFPMGYGMSWGHQRVHTMNYTYFNLRMAENCKTADQLRSELLFENLPLKL